MGLLSGVIVAIVIQIPQRLQSALAFTGDLTLSDCSWAWVPVAFPAGWWQSSQPPPPRQLPWQRLFRELAHTICAFLSIPTEAWPSDNWLQHPKPQSTLFLKHHLTLTVYSPPWSSLLLSHSASFSFTTTIQTFFLPWVSDHNPSR